MGGYQIETLHSATGWLRANKYSWMNAMREGLEIVWMRLGTHVCNGEGRDSKRSVSFVVVRRAYCRGRLTVNGATRMRMNEAAHSGNEPKKKSERASERTRVYVRAEHAAIEERVVRAIGGERDFEVIVREELVEAEIQKSRESEQQVLVIASRGDAQDSLRRAHAWKMAAPRLKVLLLGMPERNEDVLFYVRGGVNGFLQINATAKEIVDAVRAVGRGGAI